MTGHSGIQEWFLFSVWRNTRDEENFGLIRERERQNGSDLYGFLDDTITISWSIIVMLHCREWLFWFGNPGKNRGKSVNFLYVFILLIVITHTQHVHTSFLSFSFFHSHQMLERTVLEGHWIPSRTISWPQICRRRSPFIQRHSFGLPFIQQLVPCIHCWCRTKTTFYQWGEMQY